MRYGAALHGFSTAVPEGLEGGGYAAVMLLDFVAHAAHVPGITRARVGRGRNNITRRLLARLKRQPPMRAPRRSRRAPTIGPGSAPRLLGRYVRGEQDEPRDDRRDDCQTDE